MTFRRDASTAGRIDRDLNLRQKSLEEQSIGDHADIGAKTNENNFLDAVTKCDVWVQPTSKSQRSKGFFIKGMQLVIHKTFTTNCCLD